MLLYMYKYIASFNFTFLKAAIQVKRLQVWAADDLLTNRRAARHLAENFLFLLFICRNRMCTVIEHQHLLYVHTYTHLMSLEFTTSYN